MPILFRAKDERALLFLSSVLLVWMEYTIAYYVSCAAMKLYIWLLMENPISFSFD